jgi:hypothetical protein
MIKVSEKSPLDELFEDTLLRKIDRRSIKINADAGAREIFVPGRPSGDSQAVIRVGLMHPIPKYSYEFMPLKVTCINCGAVIDVDNLESYEDDDTYVSETEARICPKCGMGECCPEINEETFDESMLQDIPIKGSGTPITDFLCRYESSGLGISARLGMTQTKPELITVQGEITLTRMPVIKRTSKGAWVLPDFNADSSFLVLAEEEENGMLTMEEVERYLECGWKKRFVDLTISKRQYASETPEEALKQFIVRRTAQVEIVGNQLLIAREALRQAKELAKAQAERN